MIKLYFLLLLVPVAWVTHAQTEKDLFRPDVKVTWLGIDYSHVKIIGNFAEFFDAGEKSTWQIRDAYFPQWNAIILDEPAKYDIRGMLRKGDIEFDLELIAAFYAQTRTWYGLVIVAGRCVLPLCLTLIGAMLRLPAAPFLAVGILASGALFRIGTSWTESTVFTGAQIVALSVYAVIMERKSRTVRKQPIIDKIKEIHENDEINGDNPE